MRFSMTDLKLGQYIRNYLDEQQPCNVVTCLSHTDTSLHWPRRTSAAAKVKCRTSGKDMLYFFSQLLDFGSTHKHLKLVLEVFIILTPNSPGTQKLRLLPPSFWPTASRSESGSWPEPIHQQSSFWGVAPAHTATQHPAPSTLSIINSNTSQNQLSQVKRIF